MINGTNLLRKDKARRSIAAAPLPGSADLPRALSARLFRRNDTEAGWWHWEVTELRGGLARGYRDARFDVLRQLHDAVAQFRYTAKPSDGQP